MKREVHNSWHDMTVAADENISLLPSENVRIMDLRLQLGHARTINLETFRKGLGVYDYVLSA